MTDAVPVEQLVVSDEEWDHFIATMNNPAGPTPALQKARERMLGEAVIAAARKIERALYEDTNAADCPCCGWGPLWIELRDALAALDAARASHAQLSTHDPHISA